ncbi:MAG: type II toxin-antitoxin system VapC family toxin [Tepidisphaeraceae bacterium]
MKSCVVDASAVAAAFFPEQQTQAARKLLVRRGPLLAPDLIYCELTNVIWKRWRRNEIDAADAGQLLDDFLSLPLQVSPSAGLVDAALRLAIRTERTVYDCLYLALAIREEGVMVSADRRLVNSLSSTPLRDYIAWIGEYV